MIQKIKIQFFSGLIFVNNALAQGSGRDPGSGGTPPVSGGVQICNPLSADCGPGPTAAELVNTIISTLVIKIAPPIVAIMVLWGAFQLLTSGGDPEKVKKGKNTILWTALGYGIALIALGVTSVIKSVLGVS